MPTDNTTNKISTTGITQDALGNITNDGSHTYTFDAENRITQVDSGSTATYVYDAFNRRVKKTVGATAREFLFDAADRPFVEVGNSGTSWVRTEIFIGGTHLATYSNGHTYFHHQNWLGSRATTTDETGAKVQDCEWYPFGDLKGCTTNTNLYAYTPYGFADYERDSETGLDHMQYRYYNSRIGRFMSADPLSGNINAPQSVNKFGYVQNNSTNAIDPLGLQDNVCGAEFSFSDCGGGSGFWGGGSFGNSVGQYNHEYGGLPPHVAEALERYNFIMKNHYDPLTQCRYSDGSFGGGSGYMCGDEDSGGPFGPYQFGRNQITTGRVTIGCRNVEDSAGSGAGHCLIVLFDGKNYTLIEAFPICRLDFESVQQSGNDRGAH